MPKTREPEPLRESAQIIPFPARREGSRLQLRNGARAVGMRLPNGVTFSDCGSGWYHEAAIQEDSRKRPPR